MTQTDLAEPAALQPPRLGRKRDHTRDAEILDAALDVLAEIGYDRMTIDMVAARAKAGKATLYRRWPSKPELVLDAVACMKSQDIDYDNLPDTGTLRGDLVAQMKPPTIRDAERKMQVMAGIVSLLADNPELAETARQALIEPRAAANRIFFTRAIERGEISPDVDLDMLCLIGPAMAAYRTLMLRKPIDREYLMAIIDRVVLPAAGLE